MVYMRVTGQLVSVCACHGVHVGHRTNCKCVCACMVYMRVTGQLVSMYACHGVYAGHRTTCRKALSLHCLPEPQTPVLMYLRVLCVDERVPVTSQRTASSVIPWKTSISVLETGFLMQYLTAMPVGWPQNPRDSPVQSSCTTTLYGFSKLTSGPYACLESTLLNWISRNMPPSLFWFLRQGLMSSRLIWSSYVAKG